MTQSTLNLGRYTEPPIEELTPAQREARTRLIEGGRGSVPPPYRLWLNSPELVHKIEGLGQFLLRGSSLSTRENEIGILTMARHLNCAFVVSAHARAAKRAGLPPEVIEALCERTAPSLSDPREQVVYEVAVTMPSGPPPEPLYQRALQLLGQQGVAELTALLGYYSAVAFILNFHDVPALPPAPA